MSGYEIVDNQKIESHVTFIRINPTDIGLTLKTVFQSLSELSWINAFDQDYLKEGFTVRATATIEYISKKIIKSEDDKITTNSGEYVISELARMAVISELEYADIPLAELIKIKDVGNHGFDFYSKNKDAILLFGEAKYKASQNSYGSSLEQIVRFEKEKSDASDLIDIDRFCCEDSKRNFKDGSKGFIAAFASKGTSTAQIISGIKKNKHFIEISKHKEIICIAVNI